MTYYLSASAEWLQGFAVSTIVIGYLCIIGGAVLWAIADIAMALITKHS